MASKNKNVKPDFLNLGWSKQDDQLLAEMIERGVDGTTLARSLGRTRASVFARKNTLGIKTRIKRTPRGKADPLSYSKNGPRSTEGEKTTSPAPIKQVESVKAKPKKKVAKKKTEPKQQAEVKSEKGRLSQSAKLVHLNRRLRRGDVKKVSDKTGFTVGFVSAVLSGLSPNERVINTAYNMLRGRKTNEQMMKK